MKGLFLLSCFFISNLSAHPLFDVVRSEYLNGQKFEVKNFINLAINGRCFKENTSKTFGSTVLIREFNQDNGPIGSANKFLAGSILISNHDQEFDLKRIDEVEAQYEVNYNEFEVFSFGKVYLDFDSMKNFVFSIDPNRKFIYALLTEKTNETKVSMACYYF